MAGPKSDNPKNSRFKVNFDSCPVKESLGILGRKWALIIIRNIAIYRKQRFNEMIRFTPGINRRVLSMRLDELYNEGFIEAIITKEGYTKWELTEKGKDVLPILMAFVNFGVKWYADEVFHDQKARALTDIFEEEYIDEIMGILTHNNTV